MRENLNAIKRLVAFTLTVLLLGTTIGNDVFVIATEENHCSEYVDEQTYAANILQPVGEGDGYCDHCGQVEQAHVHVEEEPVVEEDVAVEEVQPAEELPAEEPVEDISVPEEPQPEIESTEEAVPINDEEIVPEDTPVIDEETPEENIENPEEEIVEEEECEHEWTYTSNGDGTHVKKCSKCDEESTEDCVFGEDGKCIHCGYEKEEECEHEWEYISNNDGTHIKRCKKCGEEVTETCQLDENGICHDCLYEDERLMYQEFSKTIHGVKVTVAGDMPRGAKATIFAKPLEKANRIINENIDEGSFSALDVFDIDIYKRSGEKYQPSEDGNTVEVSFIGISELTEVDDEDVVVYRIEEDESVTEISSDVVGAGVYFDAEHFSQYIVGTKSSRFVMLASYQHFATIREATGNIYTRVLKAKFDIQAMIIGEVYTFNAYVYKNLIDDTNPTSGTLVASAMNVPITVSNQLEGVVEIDLSNSTNGYIAAGEKYSIVVECTNDLINVGYGTQKDTTYDAPTYIYDGSSWERASENDEIFYIVVGDTIELSDKTDDNYVIDSIVAANGKADGNGYYHYSKGDTDTLTAIIKDASNNVVDRDVTWSVPAAGSSVLTVDSKGNIKAIGVGNVDVTASYVNSTGTVTKSVKIYVLSFTIDGWDPDGIASQADTAPLVYTGSPITPAVVAYDGSGSTVSVGTAFDKNTDAGSKANVKITYSTNGETYTYIRYFTISQASINNAAYFASATLDPGTGKINGISAVNGYKPVQDTDFTATIGSPTASAAGIEYNVEIVGKGNFKDNYTWTKTLTGMDISTILTAKLTSQGLNLKDYTYTGDNVVLTTDTDGAWKEVAFYNEDNEQIKNIINSTNATYKITDKDGTEESASKAGKKTITFTMNSGTGYTGSIQVDFDINQRSMLETSIKWNHNNVENNNKFDHTGSPITVVPGTDFDVFYGSKKLTPYDESKSEAENKNADYKMSYIGDRTKIDDTPMIRVTAVSNGNYMLYNQSSFLIVPCYRDLIVRINDGSNHDGTINNNYVTGYNEYFDPNQKSKYFAPTDSNYDATENSPNIKVVLEGMQIVEGTDYKVEVFDDEACKNTLTNSVSEGGTKYILVSPIPGGKFDGKDPIKASYIVEKTPLNTLKVTYNSNVTRTFTGKEQKVTESELIIKQGTTTLTPGTDYEINYYNNTNAGTATFDIVGKGNYTGTLSNTSKYKFTIAKASMADGNTDGVVVGLDETKTYPYNGKVYMPKVKLSIVKDGATTFTETIDPALNNSLATDNFTVEYDQSPSPGPKNVTFKATANGNFKDLVVKTALFTVGTNTANYSIFVTGANGVNQAVPMPTGHEVTDASGKITRYYYLDSNFVTYYTGATQACGIRVVDSEGQELKKNKDYGSYYNPSTSVNAYVKQVSEYTTASTPHIVINGIGSYKNNNAIVYFNIQPKPISETIITPDDIQKLDYDSAAPVVPNYTLKNGSTTLLIDTDYTVSIYDVDLETGTRSDDPDKQKAAGKKIAVIEGIGNYTGTVEKEYYVGINVEDYASLAMTNPFDTSEAFPKASTGYQIRWSSGHAPIITMTWKRADNEVITESFDGGDGTSNPDGTYVTFSPAASITASGMGLYDSRAPKNKDKVFNEITLTVAAKANTQFYGSTEVKYTIMPASVKLDTSSNQYKVTWSGSQNCDYTGADIAPALTGKYKYGTETEHSYTLTENDYYFDPEKISKDKTPGTPVPVKINGWGNFDEDETARFLIKKGVVNVFYKQDASSDYTFKQATTNIEDAEITMDLGGLYTYEVGEAKCPVIKLTSSADTTYNSALDLASNQYTITYPELADQKKSGEKTITVKITGDNYIAQTVKIKYTIKTNSIADFYGTVADVNYTANPVTTANINTSSIILKPSKASTTVLKYGTDYVLVTSSADDLDAINDQFAPAVDYEDIIITNKIAASNTNASEPSYGTNYIFVKGMGAYSGYCKIPFNIVLDITSTTDSNQLAKVTFPQEKYLLSTEATDLIPTISYKLTPTATEFLGTIPQQTAVDGQNKNNYEIHRSNPGKPGPDNIEVEGKYLCTGTAGSVKHKDDGKQVCLLANLADYAGISLAENTIYDFENRAIDPKITGLSGTKYDGTNVDTADYSLSYKYKLHTTDTDWLDKSEAKDVGYYNVIVTATANSKYYTSNSGTRFNFYIKYNLETAKMTFVSLTNYNTAITEISYTGSAFPINKSMVITSKNGTKGDIYTWGDPVDANNTSGTNVNLVNLVTPSVTGIGTHKIRVTPRDSGLVSGNYLETDFTVKGVSLQSADFSFVDPGPFTYIGSSIEPEVKAVLTVGTKTIDLYEGTDFRVHYHENTNVGTNTAYVSIEGLGSYECPEFEPGLKFSINQLDLSDTSHVLVEVDDETYNGYLIDPKDASLGFVTANPKVRVYYVDNDKQIKNLLQEKSGNATSGDWEIAGDPVNATVAAKKTDSTPPTVNVKAPDNSRNTKNTASGTFNINKLNLSAATLSKNSAEYTGEDIDISDIIEITVPYTYKKDGKNVTVNVPLVKQGQYPSLVDDAHCDYKITITGTNSTGENTNMSSGKVKEVGVYTIEITGMNSCTSTIQKTFTVTERSLRNNWHYYFDLASNSYKSGPWSNYYDETNKRYVVEDALGNKGLKVFIYDVETVNSADNPKNEPKVLIEDMLIADGTDSSDPYKHLQVGVDYTIEPHNNTGAGTAAWNKDGDDTKHSTVASGSPYVTITGMGMYKDSIDIPYNIGKNINTQNLTITYTANGNNYGYNKSYDNPTAQYLAANGGAWSYTYNGYKQVPTVTVYKGSQRLTKDKHYSVTYTNMEGNEDSSTYAGWKNIVITGIGDYCGTMSQTYAINKKKIDASGGPFTTQTDFVTTNGALTFLMTGSRFTSGVDGTVYKYLVDLNKADNPNKNKNTIYEADAGTFVNYYYAIYNGEPIEPKVTVKDNTLGTSGNQKLTVSDEDLKITYSNQDKATEFEYNGTTISYTTSDIEIKFANEAPANDTTNSAASDFSTGGNYYVPNGAKEYHIKYIIVQQELKLSDFEVQFINGLADAQQDYNHGNAITPRVKVVRLNSDKEPLIQDTDYQVTYKNNVKPSTSTENGKVIVEGINNYRGTQELDFYINGDLADTKVYWYNENNHFEEIDPSPVQQYTGTKISVGNPQIYLVLPAQNDQQEDVVLTYGTDYIDVDWHSDDSYVKSGWVLYSGNSAYWGGEKKVDYDIQFESKDVKATNYEKDGYEFTGREIKPKFGVNITTAQIGTITYDRVEVNNEGKVATILKHDTTDFTSLGYIRATIPYTVGSYSDVVEAIYEIKSRPIGDCTVEYEKTQRYTGRTVQPNIVVFIQSKNLQTGDDFEPYTLTEGVDYKVNYGNYICNNYDPTYDAETGTGRAGKGLFVLTGNSDEITKSSTKAYEYAIQLQQVANLRVTENTGDTMTVEWVRDVYSNGTDIQLQKLDENGVYKTYETSRVVGKNSTYKFENLKSSTSYRVIATAYAKLTDGTEILSKDTWIDEITEVADTEVKVVSNSAGKAKVSWTPTGDVVLYYIYRAEDEVSEGKVVAIIPASTGAYTNSKLTSGKTYYYHIDGYAIVDGVLSDKPVNSSKHVPVTVR